MSHSGLCKALVLAVLLAVSTAYVAAVESLLPFSGRALLDVELVCRNSTPTAPTTYSSSTVSAFRYSLKYSAATVYPFYVERMQTDDYVRTYYTSASQKYVVSDSRPCNGATAASALEPDVLVALLLRDLLSPALPSSPTTGTIRGISVQNFTKSLNLLIPSEYGGLGSNVAYSAVILTSVAGWKVNLMADIDQTILSVELTSSSSSEIINNCLLTFTFYGADMSASLPTSKPSECAKMSSTTPQVAPRVPYTLKRYAETLVDSDSAPTTSTAAHTTTFTEAPTTTSTAAPTTTSTAAPTTTSTAAPTTTSTAAPTTTSTAAPTTTTTTTTAAPNTNTLYAMPEFPPVFTANFLVISPSQKSIYQVREAYDTYYQTSRAQLQYPTTGAAGRVYDYDWFVSGYDQMTYYHETFAVPEGQETISKAVREYFWPDTDKCTKLLIGYDILASSAETLLLSSSSTPPTFIGNETVRNIPCGVWTADVGGARVTWYWATPGLSNVASFKTATTDYATETYGTLVRMTVSGKGGAAPLFPHHPFFPQGYAFPAADRWTACSKLEPTDTDMSCDGWSAQQTFNYIYDITSFVPYVRSDDHYMSTTCSSASLSGSIPSFGCSYSGVAGAVVAVLLVIVAVLFGLMGGSCVWCRYSRMVRRQQEELVRLTQELQNPSPPVGPLGGAAMGGDANAWSTGAPDMKPLA